MRSSVQDLLSLRSPTAIGRGVITVIINTVDAMLRRWLATHVCKKDGVIIPSWIDRNAATIVVAASRIVTTFTQSAPRLVFWSTVRLAVLCKTPALSFLKPFKPRASAISRSAIYQMARVNCLFLSALTATATIGDIVFGSVAKTYDGPTIEALTTYGIWHWRLLPAFYSTGGKP